MSSAITSIIAPVLGPLYGGGFWPALAQLCLFYNSVGAILHWVVPALVPVHSIQANLHKPGVVLRDSIYSFGELQCWEAVWDVPCRLV